MRPIRFLISLIVLSYANISPARDFSWYLHECSLEALERMQVKAAKKGLRVFEETLRVVDVEDAWYNPVITLWYQADTVGNFAKINQVMHKSYYQVPTCF